MTRPATKAIPEFVRELEGGVGSLAAIALEIKDRLPADAEIDARLAEAPAPTDRTPQGSADLPRDRCAVQGYVAPSTAPSRAPGAPDPPQGA